MTDPTPPAPEPRPAVSATDWLTTPVTFTLPRWAAFAASVAVAALLLVALD
jgi:hypothetical protein